MPIIDTGKKYDDEGNVRPQEPDHATCHFAKSARIFKNVRDMVAKNDIYINMRKEWRSNESTHASRVDALAVLQAMLRDHSIPEDQMKYLGERIYYRF